MKCYISGKITGCPVYTLNFELSAKVVRELGLTPVSPITEKQMPYWCYMVRAVWMMLWCREVSFQDNWLDSRGARIEHFIARITFKKRLYEQTKGLSGTAD